MIFRNEMVMSFGSSRLLVVTAAPRRDEMDVRRLVKAGVSGMTGETLEDEEARQDDDECQTRGPGKACHQLMIARGDERDREAAAYRWHARRKPG
ncbi:hypothetical protein [Bosea sp. (in: a-proteobacteria)]|uniref:hypothetical protein n=1 Tax=Bosea sp. (in: a-proteobacteria) TaxID=1871050 RepID=UPI001ACC5C7A|nr:hypothetical protein [Bosea sp. (in: a-proteobacteria)]MBN9435809.1 hypothetical protein [Bosea sp. (in: a-proteobacteria)]